MTISDELAALAVEIVDLGEKIEVRRRRVAELLVGKVALERSGKRFLIKKVRVYQGGTQYRLFVEGSALKKDGTPHERNGGSCPIELLAAIKPRDAGEG